MDLMNLGQVSRKTGLKAKQNSKRDSNGMEDLNDFFHEGTDSDEGDVKPHIENGLARKLNFRKSTYKSPKRSIVPDNDFGNDDIFAPVSPPSKKRNSEYLQSLETLSPISTTTTNTTANTKSSDKVSALLTKKIVLGKNKKKKPKEIVKEAVNNSPTSRRIDSLFDSDDEDVKPEIENEQLVTRKQKLSTKSSQNEPPSATPTQKDDTHPIKTKKIVKAPPPSSSSSSQPVQYDQNSIRKSSRHKIPRLAFWRNEKIVYNTTKENGAVVREVKDVIQVPEPTEIPRLHTTSTSTSSHPRAKRRKSTIPSSSTTQEVDYESDPEIEGSEWYKTGTLSLDVLEGPGSDKKVKRVIAWTSKNENYISRKTDTDNFNLAVLFDQDREFAAAGMLELPMHGVKLMKNNDDTYFMFYVVKGLLEVTINDTKFITTKGCSFEVPMGNMYQLENKGRSIAKMFFVQAKYVTIDPNEEWD